MDIYNNALNQVFNTLMQVKEKSREVYGYDLISSISKRLKTYDSIVDKLKRKNHEIGFKDMIDNINDIAGIRIVCPIKNDIYTIIDIINQLPNIHVIEHKDYINKPKKSGYSGYHLIIETPLEIENEVVLVKVEIQIRTMAMDFWATNEHKIRYKSNKKLSTIDGAKLTAYAKIINIIDDKIMEMYNKQKENVRI